MNYLEGTNINVKEAIENKNYINLTKKVEIKVNLNIFYSLLKKTDMTEDLQSRCIEKIVNAIEKYLTEGADSNLDVI